MEVDDYQWAAQYVWPNVPADLVRALVDLCRRYKVPTLARPFAALKHVTRGKGGVDTVRWQIVPCVAFHKIMAARTGAFLGTSEPEFGPVAEWVHQGQVIVRYPEWCKISVYRRVDGERAAFVGFERWEECVGLIGGTQQPNAMWVRRPYGQLLKTTLAQALRLAFPEVVLDMPESILGDVEQAELIDDGETVSLVDTSTGEVVVETPSPKHDGVAQPGVVTQPSGSNLDVGATARAEPQKSARATRGRRNLVYEYACKQEEAVREKCGGAVVEATRREVFGDDMDPDPNMSRELLIQYAAALTKVLETNL